MTAYIVVAHSKVKPGKGEDFYRLLTVTVQKAFEHEPELQAYSVSRVEGAENEFLHIEVYDSAAGFEFHRNSDHVKKFNEEIGGLLDGDIVVKTAFESPIADDARASLASLHLQSRGLMETD